MSDNINNSISVVINTKGGVGKSTTSLQVLAPYLFRNINPEFDGDFSKEWKKVKIYDVDQKNSSVAILAESKIFDSKLIERCDQSLEQLLSKELNSPIRDYPIIFDIGNSFTKEFLETLSAVFSQKRINFIIPTKQDRDDTKNSIATIAMINSYYKNANISIVCSDSIADIDRENDVKLEFEIVFGGYFDYLQKKVGDSLFKQAGISEDKFFVIKKTIGVGNLLVRSKTWTGRTIWENSFISQDIVKNPTKNEYIKEYNNLKKKIVELHQKNPQDPEILKLDAQSNIVVELMTIFKHCENYVKNQLEATFLQISKAKIIE